MNYMSFPSIGMAGQINSKRRSNHSRLWSTWNCWMRLSLAQQRRTREFYPDSTSHQHGHTYMSDITERQLIGFPRMGIRYYVKNIYYKLGT